MHTSSPVLAYSSTKIDCTVVPATARTCSGFGIAAKALWPDKTAANLAAAAGCSERAAAYYLSGAREPTPAAVLAVINKMFT